MSNERRLFIGSKGQRSAVLRSKKGISEEDAKSQLLEKGWNMDAPHDFTSNEDGTGVFKATDKKPKKRKNKAKAIPDDSKDSSDTEDPMPDKNKDGVNDNVEDVDNSDD
jgi:hypothetical protein